MGPKFGNVFNFNVSNDLLKNFFTIITYQSFSLIYPFVKILYERQIILS